MKQDIKLLALDLDGTLLNEKKEITEGNKLAIQKAVSQGVKVVIATGRPYEGLPVEAFKKLGIQYAITANGAAIYEIASDTCLDSKEMGIDLCCRLLDAIREYDVHINCFLDGQAYGEYKAVDKIQDLMYPEPMKEYLRTTRELVDDLGDYMSRQQKAAQKFVLSFYAYNFENRQKVWDMLATWEDINLVTGGYDNVEINRSDVTKGESLKKLASMWNIDITQTMACGDTQNDIDIIKTAGIGVAMGNATEDVKTVADYITASNEEDGVAKAIEKMVLA